MAGLCSGAFVLAAAGLLDGRGAAAHWALAAGAGPDVPKVRVKSDQLYIDDGDVLTAGGGAAGMDLGLHLLRGHCGAAVANRLARSMVVPPHRPGGQAQYIEYPLPAPDDGARSQRGDDDLGAGPISTSPFRSRCSPARPGWSRRNSTGGSARSPGTQR